MKYGGLLMPKIKYMPIKMWKLIGHIHCSEMASCDLSKIGEFSKTTKGIIKKTPGAYMIPEDN